jgi:hypothetical protein
MSSGPPSKRTRPRTEPTAISTASLHGIELIVSSPALLIERFDNANALADLRKYARSEVQREERVRLAAPIATFIKHWANHRIELARRLLDFRNSPMYPPDPTKVEHGRDLTRFLTTFNVELVDNDGKENKRRNHSAIAKRIPVKQTMYDFIEGEISPKSELLVRALRCYASLMGMRPDRVEPPMVESRVELRGNLRWFCMQRRVDFSDEWFNFVEQADTILAEEAAAHDTEDSWSAWVDTSHVRLFSALDTQSPQLSSAIKAEGKALVLCVGDLRYSRMLLRPTMRASLPGRISTSSSSVPDTAASTGQTSRLGDVEVEPGHCYESTVGDCPGISTRTVGKDAVLGTPARSTDNGLISAGRKRMSASPWPLPTLAAIKVLPVLAMLQIAAEAVDQVLASWTTELTEKSLDSYAFIRNAIDSTRNFSKSASPDQIVLIRPSDPSKLEAGSPLGELIEATVRLVSVEMKAASSVIWYPADYDRMSEAVALKVYEILRLLQCIVSQPLHDRWASGLRLAVAKAASSVLVFRSKERATCRLLAIGPGMSDAMRAFFDEPLHRQDEIL